uniref:Uncharacterized protein n=1 Tax=Myotis myotis TaxID=51298 RepID=A0A7J7SRF1_MYOMY|nr:hypothetical protein mMyoMyo1_009399 [Myotis myotis]
MYWLIPRPHTGSVSTWHNPCPNPPSVTGTDVVNPSRRSPCEPGASLTGLHAAPPINPRWHPLLQEASLLQPQVCSPPPAHAPLVLVLCSPVISFLPACAPARLRAALVSPRSSPVPGTLYISKQWMLDPGAGKWGDV